MGRNPSDSGHHDSKPVGSLAAFACPNPDCSHFNRFDAGNLSVVEWAGKREDIRRLYCSACKRRFTERQGTLLRYCKLPEETVVRIIKCLGHGCSVEATADICEVDPRTVERLREQAGRRADRSEWPIKRRPTGPRHGHSRPVKRIDRLGRHSRGVR